jgi:hypothetical protein
MKSLPAFFLLSAAATFAQSPAPAPATPPAAPAAAAPAPVSTTFPGLKVIMTPEEYARAGLDALTPDQIGVIDAALIRHYSSTVTLAANQVVQQMQIGQQTEVQQAVNEAVAQERHSSWLAHVGLPEIGGEWKNQPSVTGRCTGWVTGNSFRLDNDQVWEGVEPIRMELSGHDIEIQPRPNGQFALIVDGKNTTLRVYRVK